MIGKAVGSRTELSSSTGSRWESEGGGIHDESRPSGVPTMPNERRNGVSGPELLDWILAAEAEEQTGQPGDASDVITKLKGLDTGSVEFETTFTEFSAKVHQHAASEEAEVLPLLNGATTLQQRSAMEEAFLAAQMGIPSHR